MYKGNAASEMGVIYCPYKKPSIFRRLIKWIKGKFTKRSVVELFVMRVDEPSKYTGSTYPKYLVEREIGKEAARRLHVPGQEADSRCEAREVPARMPVLLLEGQRGPAPDVIVLYCLDGKMNFARKAYEESGLVRNLIDTQKEWIAGHTVREVSDELEELYMK